jgi:hypothetical protein
VPLLDLANLSDVDEALFGTWYSNWGAPAYVLTRDGRYAPAQGDSVYDAGPGAFEAPAILERGYNAWFGAPGYYADSYGVDRVIPDQYIANMYPGFIGANPWDHVFGPIGGDPVHYMQRVQAREEPIQAGEYSLS